MKAKASWSVAFDIDPAAARATRETMYPRLDRPNVIVADGHFADAVFGRVTNDGGSWVWTPLSETTAETDQVGLRQQLNVMPAPTRIKVRLTL